MSVQPEQPQLNPQTIINVQKGEIDRINDNRVYLMAVIEEVKGEANVEIGRLNGIISQLRSLIPTDSEIDADAIVNGAVKG